MNVKPVITLILGLVFQLAQMMPAAVVTSPCASHGVSCACCAGPDSCHCADNSEPNQKPSPLAPEPGTSLKFPNAKAEDTRVSVESIRKIHSSATVAASPVAGAPGGYAGVRLSVAFCSFVM
jgi:hypothetical protein